MPVYKGRRPGTWRVVVSIRGRQHEEIVRGSYREASSREAELRLLNPTQAEQRAGLTLEQWMLGPYLDLMRTRARSSTCYLRKQSIRLLLPLLPGERLATISTAAIDRAIAARCKAVMVSTVRRDFGTLRHALRCAADSGHRVGEHNIRLPPLPPSRAEAYSDQELLRLFAAADALDQEFGRLLRWLLLTGLRRGEALAARKAWVRGTDLHIPHKDTVTGWRPKSSGRVVPMGQDAVRLLHSPHEKLWRWSAWPTELATSTWHDAGLSGLAHRLRHTFASKFLAELPDLWLLGKILGHRSIKTTEMYLHMIPGRLEAARGAVRLPKVLAASLAAQA